MEASSAHPLLFLLAVVGATVALIVLACVGWAAVSRDDRSAPPSRRG